MDRKIVKQKGQHDWTADKPVPVKGTHQSEIKDELDLLFLVDIARPSPWGLDKINKLKPPLNYKDEFSEICLQYIDRIVTNHKNNYNQATNNKRISVAKEFIRNNKDGTLDTLN